ncbi:chemotaxis protein CheX [bacterium LRH843]|nr:chemotaxis protein CheX [bacterium LRH843]
MLELLLSIDVHSETLTHLLNGMSTSMMNVLQQPVTIAAPKKLEHPIQFEYGVLIGIFGDIEGKLLLTGDVSVFSTIGETMFGMPLEGEMLTSFCGELGNMIAGGFSTIIVGHGITTDISSPTIMRGNTTLSGHKQAHQIQISLCEETELIAYLLVD